jgi:hypothetical protein
MQKMRKAGLSHQKEEVRQLRIRKIQQDEALQLFEEEIILNRKLFK